MLYPKIMNSTTPVNDIRIEASLAGKQGEVKLGMTFGSSAH